MELNVELCGGCYIGLELFFIFRYSRLRETANMVKHEHGEYDKQDIT